MSKSLSNIFKERDIEVYNLLERILKRPGLYVGIERFDYVELFFNGYFYNRKSEISILPNKELQYWLLHNQSASINGTVTGTTLFYRCFGIRKSAFESYKIFLNVSLPEKLKYVDEELYQYEKNHNIVSLEHNLKLVKTIYDDVCEMVRNAGFEYDEIKIYIKKERLFNQIRFLLKSNNDWIEDSQVIEKPENHNLLISIHSKVRNATTENLRSCGYDVFDCIDFEKNLIEAEDIKEEVMLLTEYNKWKNGVFGKY